MSVRNATGIGLGGALRSPQIIGGLALAAAITIAAVALVYFESNDSRETVAPPAASVPDVDSPSTTFNTVPDVLPSTVYIVTSEEAAETLRLAIVEGDNIRVNMGLAPSTDSVAVVANEAEAVQLEAAINDGNAILASQGKPGVTVVRPQMEAPAPTDSATSVLPSSHEPNYPASREGVRGHLDSDAVSTSGLAFDAMTIDEIIAEHDNAIGAVLDQR